MLPELSFSSRWQSRSQSFVPLDQRSENESSGSIHFQITVEITEFCISGFTAHARALRSLHDWYPWRMPEMDAPRALVFRPLVKGNEALGTRLSRWSKGNEALEALRLWNSLRVLAPNFQDRRCERIRNFIEKYLCHPWVVYSIDSGYKSIDCCRVFTSRFWLVSEFWWMLWCLLEAVGDG